MIGKELRASYMSRNLCRDTCFCDYQFTIADFVGKPIEFRQYGRYSPCLGCKLICPQCGKVFFGYIRYGDHYWDEPKKAFEKRNFDGIGTIPNRHYGKFARKVKCGSRETYEHLGYYQIDLSYYETYNDEGEGIDTDKPAYLTQEDNLLTRWFTSEPPHCKDGRLGIIAIKKLKKS